MAMVNRNIKKEEILDEKIDKLDRIDKNIKLPNNVFNFIETGVNIAHN